MTRLPLGRRHRPIVAWYGNSDLLPHLARLGGRGAIDVVVTWGTALTFEEQSDRKAVARTLERDVRRMTAGALRGRTERSQPVA